MSKYWRLITGLFVTVIFSFIFTSNSFANSTSSNRRLIIKFVDSATSTDQDSFISSNNLTKKKSLSNLNIAVVEVPVNIDLSQTLVKLKKNSKVAYVEPDDLVVPEGKPSNPSNSIKPNDPSYRKQWHLPKIQADRAWYRNKATGVKLGVCDSGVQANHPDLINSLIPSLGYNTVDNTTNWAPIASHGTMVAGTMAATTNNSLGVAGVAWGAKIIPVRISNSTDGSAYVSDAAECLVYLADRGAKAANVSYSMRQYSAIDTAAKYGLSKNMITVMSGGNEGADLGYPDWSSYLAVSATTSSDQLASFSSFGNHIDLAAPGASIYTTTTNSGYSSVNGTSFAAPIVVGTIGMMYGANPNLSAAQTTAILLGSTDDLGPIGEDIYFGRGRVNVYKSVYNASFN